MFSGFEGTTLPEPSSTEVTAKTWPVADQPHQLFYKTQAAAHDDPCMHSRSSRKVVYDFWLFESVLSQCPKWHRPTGSSTALLPVVAIK